MVHDVRHDSTANAVGFMLLGVSGGLGLDLCAKALLADVAAMVEAQKAELGERELY